MALCRYGIQWQMHGSYSLLFVEGEGGEGLRQPCMWLWEESMQPLFGYTVRVVYLWGACSPFTDKLEGVFGVEHAVPRS